MASPIVVTKSFDHLTLSTLDKIFSRQHFEICFLFSQESGFDISCKLSQETICMKCQILFSGKNKKYYEFEFDQRTVKVKPYFKAIFAVFLIPSR